MVLMNLLQILSFNFIEYERSLRSDVLDIGPELSAVQLSKSREILKAGYEPSVFSNSSFFYLYQKVKSF